MPDPMTLGDASIVVGGLGLMGGSLALALRGHCHRLLGWDPDLTAVEEALRTGAVDEAETGPDAVVPQADLVILAAPVGAILECLRRLPALHFGSPVILDLGSTKADVVRAMDELPPRFDPIGGHPMCGKETSGLAHTEAHLFRGARFALTPLPRTTARARRLAEQLALAVGASPLWLDAVTHDRWVAATSHLPFLVAAALVLSTPGEAFPLIGPGFASTTRLAGSNPVMMLDILRTNRSAVLAALKRFRRDLDALEDTLAREADTAIAERLADAASLRRSLPYRADGGHTR